MKPKQLIITRDFDSYKAGDDFMNKLAEFIKGQNANVKFQLDIFFLSNNTVTLLKSCANCAFRGTDPDCEEKPCRTCGLGTRKQFQNWKNDSVRMSLFTNKPIQFDLNLFEKQ